MARPVRVFSVPTAGVVERRINVNKIHGIDLNQAPDGSFSVSLLLQSPIGTIGFGPFNTLPEAQVVVDLWTERINDAP